MTPAAIASDLVGKLGPELRLATPLGLGKPNRLLNALYERAAADPSLKLTVFTALSLTPPSAGNDLARRFLVPFAKRQWGDDYPVLAYAKEAKKGRLPKNVQVHEFYMQAGSGMRCPLQRSYQSINYTHVVARLVDERLNGVVQMVARHRKTGRYSLSSNPDLTRDLVDRYRERGLPLAVIGVVHPDLPFLPGDAEVGADFFTAIFDEPAPAPKLFALPKAPVDAVDHAIGFHASRLVLDDGTLQIGIGSLSDALVAALLCRHGNNALYRKLVDKSRNGPDPKSLPLGEEPFRDGLHGMSEMVMDGFMHLRRAGILKRKVEGAHLQGAFFLGSNEFYDWLRALDGDDYSGVRMGRISQINQLFELTPEQRKERKRARFFNTCMQVTLLGGAASETLPDGQVVSGVGGQYNFVAMAHELREARSVLMLRSTSCRGGKRSSNIVWSHGQLTIPRHLRDVVVTEYGVADVRGRTDEETIQALVCLADAEFQEALVSTAKRNGKLAPDWQLPPWARDNHPGWVDRFVDEGRKDGMFPTYPWGSDFTPEEQRLAAALERMKQDPKPAVWASRGMRVNASLFTTELERMGLARPGSWREYVTRWALLGALGSGTAS